MNAEKQLWKLLQSGDNTNVAREWSECQDRGYDKLKVPRALKDFLVDLRDKADGRFLLRLLSE